MQTLVRVILRRIVKRFILSKFLFAPVLGLGLLAAGYFFFVPAMQVKTNCPVEPVVCQYFDAMSRNDVDGVLATIVKKYSSDPLFRAFMEENIKLGQELKIPPVIPTYVGQYDKYAFVVTDVGGEIGWMVFTIDPQEHKIARVD